MFPRTASRLLRHRRYTLLLPVVALGMLAATVTAAPATSSRASVSPRAASCPTGAAPSTQYAVLKRQPLDGSAVVAVDDLDDSVYVGTINDPTGVWVFDGAEGTLDDSVPLDWPAQGIAIDQLDDTVYVSLEGIQSPGAGYGQDDTLVVIAGKTMSITDQITVGDNPTGVAVNQWDDTVYVANAGNDDTRGNTLSIINGRTLIDDTHLVGLQPFGVAVDSVDDTVYVANNYGASITVINGSSLNDSSIPVDYNASSVAVDGDDDSISVSFASEGKVALVNQATSAKTYVTVEGGQTPGIAVNEADDTVYATSWTGPTGPGWLSIIDGHTGHLDDTMLIGDTARGVAVDQDGGLVYVANGTDLVVVGQASASLSTTSGSLGTDVTVDVTAPQVTYALDDTTVTLVCFGNTPATLPVWNGDDTWTTTAPAGFGTVPISVVFDGGLAVSAGTFTYVNPPPPPPTYPPGPPSDVTATAGDARATVTWRAPTDSGTYPVTDYEVTSSPGGRTCLVKAPAQTCDVTWLTNATSYTFTVRALNGAGWGSPSSPSNAVTPAASTSATIVISGSRLATSPPSVRVSGVTTGLVGEHVVPQFRFPGQTSYTAGYARPTVAADGTFTWTRKTAKKIYVYFRHDDARSNRVIIDTALR